MMHLDEKERGAQAGLFPDVVYLKALLEVEGVGEKTIRQLLTHAESPASLWEASDAFLSEHLGSAKRTAFLARRDKGLNADWLEVHQNLGIQVLAYTDSRYSALLNEIYNPPVLLYVRGNMEALRGRTLAIVGTRNAGEYGRQVTERLVQELAPAGVSIVSGLAAGVDTYAHWAALRNHLPTVAVFGCGVDIVSPSSNRNLSREILAQGGALVSEYPLGTQPTRYTFPQRNRIVAGLSHGVLVVEGDVKSGALITARLASEEGRTVFAVPGNIFSPNSEGPLHLIKNGAVPVSRGKDILDDLRWGQESQSVRENLTILKTEMAPEETMVTTRAAVGVPHQPEPVSLSEEEARLLSRVPYDPVSIEDLQRESGFSSAKINELFTLLELEGLIVLLPGARVCRK